MCMYTHTHTHTHMCQALVLAALCLLSVYFNLNKTLVLAALLREAPRGSPLGSGLALCVLRGIKGGRGEGGGGGE
jgi:hypothetical protein